MARCGVGIESMTDSGTQEILAAIGGLADCISSMESRLECVESKLGAVESRLSTVEHKVDSATNILNAVARIDR
ncbi:hypothetical protein LCGC14_0761250 [marine sediment metagenome]|uniref:BURP domain-containing protein n=1 Tax=marine sediment metagenome TaxID=412755 RepID=A0A0F9Q537_9ZZZZ